MSSPVAHRAVLEVFEAQIPQAAPQTGSEEGLSTGIMVAILASGLFTFVVLALVSAYWVRKKFYSIKPSKVANSDMSGKEGKEGMQAAVDPHMLQYYESYYQSLGYPPGTATQMLGGAAQQQHQMALPAPMMPGAMMQAAAPATLALQDASAAWGQQRQV
ncbi:ALDH3A2, partial [Symbiodinium pilosum]